jgi:uncharacterized protein (DUF1684 family)
MRKTTAFIPLIACVLTLSCGDTPPPIDPAYAAEIEAAWAEREARLTAEDGWLTLTGLFWLEPGVNGLGAADGVAVRLPDGPDEVGELILGGDGAVTLRPAFESGLTVNDAPAVEQILATDATGNPDVVRSGRALFYLIERGSRVGVRVKDPEAATRTDFAGLDHYPVDPSFRIAAAFEPYPEPREVAIPTVIGEPSTMLAPGLLHFEVDGEKVSLEPYISDPDDRDLFLVFRDATSGDTTYGAGRFLSAEIVGGTSEVVLDFNLATNPPCAFTPFATCPLPTPENTLFVAIEAGEMYGGASH